MGRTQDGRRRPAQHLGVAVAAAAVVATGLYVAGGAGETPWRIVSHASATEAGGRDVEAAVRLGPSAATLSFRGARGTISVENTLQRPAVYAVSVRRHGGWSPILDEETLDVSAGRASRSSGTTHRVDLARGTIVRLEICVDADERHCATALGRA
ncbi:hypothetical protein [Mumia sp. DW29H23]|uniref:hypothetical protein n=1 Tax=Mumia sp. DW29H23 TaxID=3421241 RepID=UPI003D695DE6